MMLEQEVACTCEMQEVACTCEMQLEVKAKDACLQVSPREWAWKRPPH